MAELIFTIEAEHTSDLEAIRHECENALQDIADIHSSDNGLVEMEVSWELNE